MTNIDLLKSIGSKLNPKWEVDSNHIWCPLTGTKEDYFVVVGTTWDTLDDDEIIHRIRHMIHHSTSILDANLSLDGEILEIPIYKQEKITTLKIKPNK